MTEFSRRTILLLCAAFCYMVAVLTFLFSTTFAGDGFGNNFSNENNNKFPKVLLTHSGRLVEGEISYTPGGYTVKKRNGTMFIPAKQVKHTAGSRTEIYYKLRKDFPNATAKQRLSLASWCISNSLYSYAEKELYDVLKKEPGHVDARKMLVRLKIITQPQRSSFKKKTKVTAALFVHEVRSLAGLSRKNATLFTRKIQPILVNKCSNGGCHGKASQNNFKLISIRSGRGSHRIFAEQNLAAIFKQIDLKEPHNSPLLTKTQGGHGRKGRTLFRGRIGRKQRGLLSQWISSVAHEQKDSWVAPPSVKKRVSTASFNKETENRQKTAQNKLLNRILEESKKDEFDPNEFNRQFKDKTNSNR